MNATDKCLQEIAKELHEINRKLDRICRASICSIGDPVISVKVEDQYLDDDKD